MNTDVMTGPNHDLGRGQSSPRAILLVEDDALQSFVLSEQLSAAGYAVTTVDNGTDACELLRRQAFPMVITDYKMPTMNGVQLVERIREEESSRHYCIVWSAQAEQKDREHSLAHGVDDHLSKQLSNDELLARIAVGFAAVEEHDSKRRLHMMRACRSVLGRDVDTDAWRAGAIRLHAQIAHAVREKQALAILMLHVERQVAPREKALLTLTQFNCLIGAINSVLRPNIDIALPLDASDGLVRLLLVLPATDFNGACAVRNHLCAAVAYSTIDEPSEWIIDESPIHLHGAIGVAAMEAGSDMQSTNAAAMIVAAERKMQTLALPRH